MSNPLKQIAAIQLTCWILFVVTCNYFNGAMSEMNQPQSKNMPVLHT